MGISFNNNRESGKAFCCLFTFIDYKTLFEKNLKGFLGWNIQMTLTEASINYHTDSEGHRNHARYGFG